MIAIKYVLLPIDACIFLGANDIKNHRWFGNIDWNLLVSKKLPVPYKPVVK